MTNTPAADQFRALGLTDESAWTETMQLAVKQRWSNLPVDRKVGDLRAALAAVVPPAHATLVELLEQSYADHPALTVDEHANDAAAELARLKRNANVNAWRARKQLQAAIDARDLKFAALRAKRSTGPAKSVTGDAAPVTAVA